jgi:peptidoglycan/xylan/chitin deacetylase (PgdA/CDA1 family)
MSAATYLSPDRDTSVTGRFVTISVDDGSADDMRTAELLHKHGLTATFYVPARNPEREVISPAQIRELSQRFDVGSHTLNHAPLKFLSDRAANHEITGGKKWIEDVLGKPVHSFCYPRGKFNGTTPLLVEKAGFLGARTSLMNLHEFPRNRFLWGVSTLAYSLRKIIHVRHALLEWNFPGLRNFFREYKGATDWQQHFAYALDYVQRHGGMAHLMLHSWEIEERGEWRKLDCVFKAIAQCQMPCVTNGDLFGLWNSLRVAVPAPTAEPVVRSR